MACHSRNGRFAGRIGCGTSGASRRAGAMAGGWDDACGPTGQCCFAGIVATDAASSMPLPTDAGCRGGDDACACHWSSVPG